MLRPSGLPLLDDILGGGIPPGVCLIESEATSGGTSLALSILREEASNCRPVVFVDTKASTSVMQLYEYTGEYGVHILPVSGEAALDSIMYSQLFGSDVCVVDTLDALTAYAYGLLPVGEDTARSQYMLLRHATNHLFREAEIQDKLIVLVADSSLDLNHPSGKQVLNTQYYRVIKSAVTSYLNVTLKGKHEVYGRTAWRSIEIKALDPSDRDKCLGSVKTRLYQQGLSRPYGLMQKLMKCGVLSKRGGIYYFDGLPMEYSTKDMARRIENNYRIWLNRAYG